MNPRTCLFRFTLLVLIGAAGSALAAQDGAAALDGGQIYQKKVCLSCHGVDGRTPILPIYPKVAGQHADYTYNQLKDIKSGARSNGQSVVMTGIMQDVTDEEMRALADWLSSQ